MDSKLIWEIIGYVASGIVFISFLMTSVVKLRVVNLIGSFIFAVYAIAIGSYPTALMNFGLVLLQIYQLARLKKANVRVTTIPIESPKANDKYLKKFLSFYEKDINKYFPEFERRKDECDYGCYVCFDMETVGLFFGKKRENNVLEIILDYTIPKYRNGSVGKALYPYLLVDEGFSKLIENNPMKERAKYLESAGFKKDEKMYFIS